MNRQKNDKKIFIFLVSLNEPPIFGALPRSLSCRPLLAHCRDPYHTGLFGALPRSLSCRAPPFDPFIACILPLVPSIICCLSLVTPPPFELVQRLQRSQPQFAARWLTHPVCFTGGWPRIYGGMYDPWRMPMPNSGMGGCALRSVVMPSILAGGLLSRSLLFGPVRLGSSAQLSAC